MVNKKVNSHDIVECIGAGLTLLDRNFRIVWVNKQQADWFGPTERLYGKHCYKMFEHRNHICTGCPTVRAFKTGQTHRAKRIGITKEGKKQYYQLTVSPIKDNHNKPIFVLELVQNITEKLLQERRNKTVIKRLQSMYKRLFLTNRKLRCNTEKMKAIVRNLSKTKRALEDKYHKKIDELVTIKEELTDIFKVNRTINSSMDSKKVAALITRLTCELMHTDACMLRLIDEQKKGLVATSGHCVSDAYIKKINIIKIGEGISGKVAKTMKPLAIYDIDTNPRVKNFKHAELIKKEGFRAVLSVPVIFHNKILGVISTYSKKQRRFLEEEIEVLRVFASQVAIAIQESKNYEDIHKGYFSTVRALILAIEARDPYTRGHTDRVTKYALETAKELNIPETELEVLRYACEVHDIGKISIPDSILNKPGRLTPAERAMVELHSVKGTEMLQPLEFLRPGLLIIRHHHEKYDGTGYPDGLKKDDIPLMARIVACADAFDAMTSDRPYRVRRLTVKEALDEIKNNSGSQFDPRVADLFVKIINAQTPATGLQ